jgi:uncharacterized membrane protein
MPLDVLSRWIHVMSAIALMGGALFAVLAVIPSLAGVDEETRTKIKASIRSRWAKVVHAGILLLLITGFYNYLAVTGPAHQGENKGLYHGLMGGKILIALGIFFLASVLVGRSQKFDAMRRQDRKWLTIVLLLASIVVGIGSFLKVAVPGSEATDENAASDDNEAATGAAEPVMPQEFLANHDG